MNKSTMWSWLIFMAVALLASRIAPQSFPHPGVGGPDHPARVRQDRIRRIMSEEKCPQTYERIWGQCIFISKELLYDFDSARIFCRGIGGELAQLKYPQVLRVMLMDNYLPDFRRTNQTYQPKYLVGASYNANKSSWQGINVEDDMGNKLSISNEDVFGSDQPNGDGDDKECLYLDTNPDIPQPFIPESCTVGRRFICEFTNFFYSDRES